MSRPESEYADHPPESIVLMWCPECDTVYIEGDLPACGHEGWNPERHTYICTTAQGSSPPLGDRGIHD